MAPLIAMLLICVEPNVYAANNEQPRFIRARFCAEQTSFEGDRILCLIDKGPDIRITTLNAMVTACQSADGSEAAYRACVDAEMRALHRAYRFLFPVAESVTNSAQEYEALRRWHDAASKERAQRCASAVKATTRENGGVPASFTRTAASVCARSDWIERLQVLLQSIPTSGTKTNPVFYPRRTQPEEELLFDPVVACTGDTSNVRANGECLSYRVNLMERAAEQLKYLLKAEKVKAPGGRYTCAPPFETTEQYVAYQRCRLGALRQTIQASLERLQLSIQ